MISCGDRENDIYEIFQAWNQRKAEGQATAEWLIRCSQNRALQLEEGQETATEIEVARSIIEKIHISPLLGEFTLEVKQKVQRKKVKRNTKMTFRSARKAVMEVRSTSVKLRPPYRKGDKLSAVSITVVMAKEKHPPKGEDPLEWILLTSLEATDYASAFKIIEMYAARWEI